MPTIQIDQSAVEQLTKAGIEFVVLAESREEFAARHGGGGVLIEKDGYIILSDGAYMTHSGDTRWEPPTNRVGLLKLLHARAAVLLQTAEAEFQNARSEFSEQAMMARRYPNSLPSPPEDAAEILQQLNSEICDRRTEVATLMEELMSLKAGPGPNPRQQYEQQKQQELYESHARINSLMMDQEIRSTNMRRKIIQGMQSQ